MPLTRSAAFLLVVAATISSTSQLGAQSDSAHLVTLIARLEGGDSSVRSTLRNEGWRRIKILAADGRIDAPVARDLARIAIEFVDGYHDLDAHPTPEEHAWRSAAIDGLLNAIRQEPGDLWSAGQLERIAPYPYLWASPDDEVKDLRALLRWHGAIPARVLATLVRIEVETGSTDSAVAHLALMPADGLTPAERGHLVAEVAFASGRDSAAAVAYYAAAREIRDSADATWFSRDLAWIAKPSELDVWDALPSADREPWLEKFWNRRDIADGRMPGSRLPEQFRRWRIALRGYRWEFDGSTARGLFIPPLDGAEYNADDVRFPHTGAIELAFENRERPLSVVLDDRGGMILRHGEPAERSNLPGITAAMEDLFSWPTPTGKLIVGFSRPMITIFDSASLRYGMVARNYPPGDQMTDCALDPRLCIVPGLSGDDLNMIRLNYTAMRDTAEHTDDNRELFDKELHASIETYGIPDVGALVVYAVPAHAISTDPATAAAPKHFAAQLRVIAGDTAKGDFVAALDTTRTWTLRNGVTGQDAMVMGYTVVPMPVGEWSVSAIMSDVGRHLGAAQRAAPVEVAEFNGASFQISDLILGSNSSGLTWSDRGTQIPLNPRNVWRPDEPAILSYALDGLVIGRAYRTEIEVWEAKGKPKTFAQALGFTAAATRTQIDFQRELSLAQLGVGDYRVVLKITDVTSGATVRRERRMLVRP